MSGGTAAGGEARLLTFSHSEIVVKFSLTWMHFVVSPADGGLRKRLRVRLDSLTAEALLSKLAELERPKNIASDVAVR